MFGTNVIRKADDTTGIGLYMQSIFSTIQGEGPFAGMPAVFVRLSGCNLRCHFCDTDFESKRELKYVKQIVDEINQAAGGGKVRRTNLVVITGGEPLIQNIRTLCSELINTHNYKVQIETAGTVWVDELDQLIRTGALTLVCSPKTGSVHTNIELLCSHWKYLIRENEVSMIDGLPEMSTQIPGKKQKLFRPTTPFDTIWLQPCEEYVIGYKAKVPDPSKRLEDMELADQTVTSSVRDEVRTRRNIELAAALAMKFNYRISVQLHKILGLP